MKEFTHLYPVQKTLRFELKPIGETENNIESFKNSNLLGVIDRDKKRAENYKIMKKLLDDYYREFIANVLNKKIFNTAELKDIFNIYKETKKKDNDDAKKKDIIKKELNTKQTELRKKIANIFKKHLSEFGLDTYQDLINGKGKGDKRIEPLLLNWLNIKLKDKKITDDDFNEKKDALSEFQGFSTYFTGFQENRDNMFSDKDQTTAIAYRIVNINMIKHFDNCIILDRIKEQFKPLYNELKQLAEIITPEKFGDIFTQEAIDNYNQLIGGDPKDINREGINQKINLYRQKNNLTSKELPIMSQLYKQILSDSQDKFTIEKFETTEEMLESISEYYKKIYKPNEIKNLIEKHISKVNLEHIFIKNDETLTRISLYCFADWGLIHKALGNYFKVKELNIDPEIKVKKIDEEKLRKYLNQDVFNLKNIQDAVNFYLESVEEIEKQNYRQTNIAKYFNSFIHEKEEKDVKNIFEKVDIDYKDVKTYFEKNIFNQKADTDKLKKFLDSLMDIIHFFKPLHLFKKSKPFEIDDSDSDFYEEFNSIYNDICILINIYNKTRNFLTKKQYSIDKIKINFDNGTLLNGWDVNKETANLGVLLLKDGKYFLGIMNKNSNKIFENVQEKDKFSDDKNHYSKMIYKLLPDPSKMLPKVFFADKNINHFNPSKEILKIKENGLYKKDANDSDSLIKWIDFCKDSLSKHPEWNEFYHFKFKDTRKYADVSEFYKDVADQGFVIDFGKISETYIDEKIKSGELYLFEIYNKDFSEYSKGKPNLHTMYWEAVFSEENLKDVVVKLNGEAEIFFRPASIKKEDRTRHPAKQELENKNPLNQKKTSKFDYEIVKDRRFTKDKLFFHCPITLNFKAKSIFKFNEKVNNYLERNLKDIKYIGIDRGERHLLYYSVVDSNRKIIEQGTLNTLKTRYTTKEKIIEQVTDYHTLLNNKEKERENARQSWSTIENIKELKSGYLSHVVHQLVTLMIKHNAVIILEDLNFGFKRGRFKIEKQVYQKFEKALIEKLNYLVFKENKYGQPGHLLNAYQLTSGFESFEKMGKQSGFLFYVPAAYTSKIDPITGFVNLFNFYYENINKSKQYFEKFESIKYSKEHKYFEFAFDYKNFTDKSSERSKWTICSYGEERYYYDSKTKKTNKCNVTDELQKLFKKYGIQFEDGSDIINLITQQDDSAFFKSLYFYLKIILQMRYTYKDNEDNEIDYILSPVEVKGKFFDSRAANDGMPKDADGNGAYHIALKGLMTISNIKNGKLPESKKGMMHKTWFEFVQER